MSISLIASCCMVGSTWEYTSIVTAIPLWPSSSCTTLRLVPKLSRRVAGVCLKSWNRIVGSPARFSNGLNDRRRSCRQYVGNNQRRCNGRLTTIRRRYFHPIYPCGYYRARTSIRITYHYMRWWSLGQNPVSPRWGLPRYWPRENRMIWDF